MKAVTSRFQLADENETPSSLVIPFLLPFLRLLLLLLLLQHPLASLPLVRMKVEETKYSILT